MTVSKPKLFALLIGLLELTPALAGFYANGPLLALVIVIAALAALTIWVIA